MIRLSKKLLANTSLAAGLALTCAAVALDASDALVAVERWLLDERIARCQFFMPPPTDRLVHLDIDDGALETIGQWPWDRSTLARVMDELALARPAAVGLDLLLTEPQAPDWQRTADGRFTLVDHDALLADAIARGGGKVVVPASFAFPPASAGDLFAAMRDALVEHPQWTEAQLVTLLRTKGFAGDAQLQTRVADTFLTARRVAMGSRLRRELEQDPGIGDDVVRGRVLPGVDPALRSPLTRLFDVQLSRARAALEMRRLARRPAAGEPAAFQARLNLVPIYPLVHAAGATAFVDYPPASDGRNRSVPLFVQHDGWLYPQMGLSLACATLGVDLRDVRIEPGRVVVPRPGIGPPLSIPTRTLDRSVMNNVGRDVPLATDLAWFGGSDWEQMYDWRGNEPRRQHLSILAVWEACDARRKLEQNNADADAALKSLYATLQQADVIADLEAHPLPPADVDARLRRVQSALDDVGDFARAAEEVPAAERDKDQAILVSSYRTLQSYAEQTPGVRATLTGARAALAKELGGRAVIVGWIATASIADFVPTPLHPKCPGPILHGVVFNSIMTGEVWRRAPRWVSPLVTLAVGLLMTGVVAHFAPHRALLAAAALAAAYLCVNGLLLFDYGNLIVGAAGPLTAVGLVWSGGTLTRLVVEQRQRALIRRRFRTYVDPRLVDYVERYPDRASFEGERREMTVVFTDLVGFTKLTEAMGEETVKVLNRLWARMVPVVRRHGYLNKFLGDGIMFFYGAPEQSDDHAAAAVGTILEMRDVMRRFNEEVRAEGLPELGMRFGVSTGDMIVGDAGAGEAGSDYTVLGDNVNLGSRLEGACKATGTTNLVTARTAELAADAFLFRPVGKLRVVGKQQGVMTFEALCHAADATPALREQVELTRRMVDAYAAGDPPACAAAADRLEAAAGPMKLAQLYRKLVERHLRDPSDEPFDGLITLSEK